VSSVTSGSSGGGGGGENIEMQALVAFQTIISELGQAAADGAASSHCLKKEEEEEEEEEEEGGGEGGVEEEDAWQMEGTDGRLHCTKCLRPLVGEGEEGREDEVPAAVNHEEKGSSTVEEGGEEGGEEEEEEEEFNLELFKMKRQACKLRDELAKKRFAELAMSVKLKETEEEVRLEIN